MEPQQKKAYLLAFTAVLFWSTVSSAFKLTLRYMSFQNLVFWSVLNGIAVLILANRLSGTPLNIKKLNVKNILSSAVMGFFNPFLYYLVLIKAYSLLEAQIAGTLNYFWPIVLVLFSIVFLKQKIKPIGILAIFISFTGIIIISTGGNPLTMKFNNLSGVLLALSSAVLWAMYWIMNLKDKREDTGKILLNMIFGLVYLGIWLIIQQQLFYIPTVNGYLGTLYIGIFEMGVTYIIWLKALKFSSDTAKVSNLIYLSPFLGLFWINLFVGETIHLSTIVGLMFIVGGILIQARVKG